MLFIELYWGGRLEEIWTSDKPMLNLPGVTKVMSRTRFLQLQRYLHFCTEGLARGDRNHPAYDKLYKLRPLLNHVLRRFQACYVPAENNSLDEGMVPYKGRLGFKQYCKDKPTKWGVKVWMLTDATNGYLHNFEVYLGKNAAIEENMPQSLSARVCLSLTKPYYGKGMRIFFDRFYTSYKVLHYLQHYRVYACGTVMINRGFPREIVPARANDMEHGESQWRQDLNTGAMAVTWKDKRLIHLLTSCHDPSPEGEVLRRDNRGRPIRVRAPRPIVDYNMYMGGVDLNDRMTGLSKSRKTYKWYSRLVRKVILWCAYNAYVLEDHFDPHNTPGKRRRTFRGFTEDLMHQLVGNYTSRSRARPGNRQPNLNRIIPQEHQHLPVEGAGKDHGCKVCLEKYNQFMRVNPGTPYSDCPYRRSKTMWKCSKCEVYLCIKKGASCFTDFHTKVQFWR